MSDDTAPPLNLPIGRWTVVAMLDERKIVSDHLRIVWRQLENSPISLHDARAAHRKGQIVMAQRRNTEGILELVAQPARNAPEQVPGE